MFFQKQKEKKSPFNFKHKKSQKKQDNSSRELVLIIQAIIKKGFYPVMYN